MILNPKLLIVDDERGIVDMIQSYFQTQYDILTAYSGQEALKKVACKPGLRTKSWTSARRETDVLL